MQDIAGCRAVLAGGSAEATGVLRRIRRNWDVITIDDYTANPKPGGYRAVHVVIRRDGKFVEIQLRTPAQHEWAETVEALQAATKYPLKDGKGPDPLLEFMQVAADGMAADEAGEDEQAGNLMTKADALRPSVEQYLRYLRR